MAVTARFTESCHGENQFIQQTQTTISDRSTDFNERIGMLWEPFLEWEISAASIQGNPFDIHAITILITNMADEDPSMMLLIPRIPGHLTAFADPVQVNCGKLISNIIA